YRSKVWTPQSPSTVCNGATGQKFGYPGQLSLSLLLKPCPVTLPVSSWRSTSAGSRIASAPLYCGGFSHFKATCGPGLQKYTVPIWPKVIFAHLSPRFGSGFFFVKKRMFVCVHILIIMVLTILLRNPLISVALK
uniref:Uncharacterized protein n=1 Tax=Astyanax mexicanus TaxID=7994 RepID=A0A8B9GXV2_ASTMX